MTTSSLSLKSLVFKIISLALIVSLLLQLSYNYSGVEIIRKILLWTTFVILIAVTWKLSTGRLDNENNVLDKTRTKILQLFYLSTAQIFLFAFIMHFISSFINGMSSYESIKVFSVISIYVSLFAMIAVDTIRIKIKNDNFNHANFIKTLKIENKNMEFSILRVNKSIKILLFILFLVFSANLYGYIQAVKGIGEYYWLGISYFFVLISLGIQQFLCTFEVILQD